MQDYDDDRPGHGTAFELCIDDYVPFVDPVAYGITDFRAIKPADYFITSGDAVSKTKFMERELWEAAGEAKRRFGKARDKRKQEFVKKLWSAAGKSRALVNKLIAVRGDSIFLECEWRDHRLYCIPKNPRAKTKEQEVENAD